MVLWYWYLLTLAALSAAHYVRLDLTLILALVAALYVPLPENPVMRLVARSLKVLAVSAGAVAVAWRVSWLPSPDVIVGFLVNPLTRPTPQYLLEFLFHALNLWLVFTGSALLAALVFLYKKFPARTAATVYGLLLLAWIFQPPQYSATFNPALLDDFYRQEAKRKPAVAMPAAADAPFDIIILHICSLSWDDMKNAGIDPRPFFEKFDYVFTGFSGGTTYSGPAALRVMKASCGQLPHPLLYTASDSDCYLFDNFRRAGYATFSMFNHNGKYADFSSYIQKYGHADPPLPTADLPVAEMMFDGSPMSADSAALNKYWSVRQSTPAARAALYYNTANLHMGSYEPNQPRYTDSIAEYRKHLTTMFDAFEGFFAEVEASGRNAVVIVLPEHGAGLVGNKVQTKDLREIPLPVLAKVPVAVRLVGPGHKKPAAPQIIAQPTGMYGVAWLLARFIEKSPFGSHAETPAVLAAGVPLTPFVAENDNYAVVQSGPLFMQKPRDGKWAILPAEVDVTSGTIPSFR